jgi:hypothetical protein
MGERPIIQLANPYPFPESIGIFGEQGSGKTRVPFSWADHCPEIHFHVLDLDVRKSYQRMLYLGFPHLKDQFTIHEPGTWAEFCELMDQLEQFGQTLDAVEALNHCLVIDTCTWVWEAAQAGYSQHVHGKGVEEYSMELRRSTATAKEFAAAKSEDGFWQDVTTLHRVQFYDRLTRWPGHLILTAEAEAPSRQFAQNAQSDEDKAMVTYGYKPRAQKRYPYIPKTLLLLQKTGRAEWQMTTIKDMEREQLERAPLEDFAEDYLMGVAGWQSLAPKPKPKPAAATGAVKRVVKR